MSALAWLRLGAVQFVQLIAMVVGWFVLLVPCALHAWRPAVSRFNGQPADEWSLGPPLNVIFGNPSEDGVSGAYAKVWNDRGERVPYLADGKWSARFALVRYLRAAWRAYLWAAWRNSADNLKYLFAWEQGPFFSKPYVLRGHVGTFKAGWQRENGVKVPVLSP